MTFKKINRIKKKKDFDLIFKKGRTVKGAFLFIRYIKEESGRSRAAIVAPARIFTKAIQRNRVRRVLSSIIRPKLDEMRGKNLAIIIYKFASEKDYIKDALTIIKKIN